MNENILALALASLPNALLTDTFFQNLCNNIPLEFKICGKIKIRKSTYLTYKNIEPILSNYFEPLQNKEDLLKLAFSYPNFLLTINITNKNDSYKLELKILDGTNIKILTFEKQTNYSKIKIISKKINKGKITSYKNEIHYYDPNYQELTNDDSLNEILKDFSNLFYIPNELALFFYQNFNKYQEELNKSRIKSEIELDNLTRPINEEYAFMEPMTLERIKFGDHHTHHNHAEGQQIVGVDQGALDKHGRPCIRVFRRKVSAQVSDSRAHHQQRSDKDQRNDPRASHFHKFNFQQV